ncbi:hypothetical protein M0D42_13655 [Cognatishimia activa]|nr:hypothetical protein [Cognatishimia activa]UZD90621.1 hypothetical protein M0D42_13655 [Cognatishimia activa]
MMHPIQESKVDFFFKRVQKPRFEKVIAGLLKQMDLRLLANDIVTQFENGINGDRNIASKCQTGAAFGSNLKVNTRIFSFVKVVEPS